MENPYQSPMSDDRVIGVKSGSREDLRKVATYQRGILFCILFYLLLVAAGFVLPPSLKALIGVISIVLSITGTVFVFMLAIKVYSTGVGILLGVLTLIPCIGLITLLIVNGKATAVLRDNGIKVGLLGADPSTI